MFGKRATFPFFLQMSSVPIFLNRNCILIYELSGILVYLILQSLSQQTSNKLLGLLSVKRVLWSSSPCKVKLANWVQRPNFQTCFWKHKKQHNHNRIMLIRLRLPTKMTSHLHVPSVNGILIMFWLAEMCSFFSIKLGTVQNFLQLLKQKILLTVLYA